MCRVEKTRFARFLARQDFGSAIKNPPRIKLMHTEQYGTCYGWNSGTRNQGKIIVYKFHPERSTNNNIEKTGLEKLLKIWHNVLKGIPQTWFSQFFEISPLKKSTEKKRLFHGNTSKTLTKPNFSSFFAPSWPQRITLQYSSPDFYRNIAF